MPPPENKTDGSRTTGNRPNDQMAANNLTERVTHVPARRTIPGQTSIVPIAYVHEPRPGRVTADMFPEKLHCPRCGFQRKHRATWPPDATATKRCTCCGYSDDFALEPVKAIKATSSRGRRAGRAA